MKDLIFTGCSIPILILIIIALYVRKTTRGQSNRYFLIINYVTLAVAIIDFTNGILRNTVLNNNVVLVISYTFSTLYFLMRNTSIFLYLIFLIYTFRIQDIFKRKWLYVLLMLPLFVVFALVLSNPIHHQIFTVDLVNSYQRQPLINVLYVMSLVYGLAGMVLLFICIRFISFSKWICLQSIYILTIIAVLGQYLNSSLQIEIFSTALSLLIVAFFVLRPEELSDARTGLHSYTDYQLELKKANLAKQRLCVQMIKITNISNIQTYYGEVSYLGAIKEIANYYYDEAKRDKLTIDIFFEEPGNLYILVEDETFDCQKVFENMLSFFREQSSSENNVAAYLKLKGCGIVLPKDTENLQTVLRLGHAFDRYLEKNDSFCYGRDIIHQREYIIESNLREILREAIKNNRFEMYYQPIYDIRAGKFLSAEALIRLNDPEFGIIMPGLFIPAAEQRNMLGPIGEFVLEDVFRFVGSDDFQNSRLEFVEINLSVHQAIDPSLIYRVESLQNKYHVQPSQINFEVTESIYSQDHELLDYNLEKLKEMGYQLSLDDYGTGYSNINRVLSLPLSIIKFDKSLVDASDSEKGRSVLGYSILMMRNIRKAILVEGVETKEKVDQVISLGAEYIQGFYYSKPLPVPQFLEFIATHN